jgi:hypothetical protein
MQLLSSLCARLISEMDKVEQFRPLEPQSGAGLE